MESYNASHLGLQDYLLSDSLYTFTVREVISLIGHVKIMLPIAACQALLQDLAGKKTKALPISLAWSVSLMKDSYNLCSPKHSRTDIVVRV